ncbi:MULTISPECIES: hypothetical protein [Arsenophonus]|uniref:hypothetical protein n=1 Tax=Arsenophonus TaxID=637 RepID=UPI001CDC1377|nr:hypothetical protein [Arsenophonus apicola]UBX27925.1 hypothetical protein LDL57_08510 [Arsenophonus apicola]
MIEKKFYPFKFNMNKSIPEPIAHELVAIKQVLLAIIATDYEKRQVVLDGLSEINSPIMKDVVKNIKLIDANQL